MKFKFYFIFLVICLCVTACGSERFEGVVYDLIVPPAEVQTELPPSIWQALKDIHACSENLYSISLEQLFEEQKKYYNRYIDAGGIAIIGNDTVADEYFLQAREVVMVLTSKHPELRYHLQTVSDKINRDLASCLRKPGYYAILTSSYGFPEDKARPVSGVGMSTASLREFARHPITFEAVSWVAHGWSYSLIIPPANERSTDIFVHEFGHALHAAIRVIDTEFNDKLKKAYTTAMEAGKYKDTKASQNYREYWAEGVETWYIKTGLYSDINLYEEIAEYDPLLFALLDEWLPQIHVYTFR